MLAQSNNILAVDVSQKHPLPFRPATHTCTSVCVQQDSNFVQLVLVHDWFNLVWCGTLMNHAIWQFGNDGPVSPFLSVVCEEKGSDFLALIAHWLRLISFWNCTYLDLLTNLDYMIHVHKHIRLPTKMESWLKIGFDRLKLFPLLHPQLYSWMEYFLQPPSQCV